MSQIYTGDDDYTYKSRCITESIEFTAFKYQQLTTYFSRSN